MSSLLGLTGHELQALLTKKEISSTDLVKEYLTRIKMVDDQIKALVTVTEKEALEQARKADGLREKGVKLSPLAGIPLALSDNICTAGIRTTCSSRMLENFVPPYKATVVEKLAEAKAVLVGKCNLDEFGLGTTTENSAFFATHNPHDLQAVPGGACGGAAAAVAGGEAVFALGTDTGGSLREPASFCGVIGFKPTYGSVSRYGVIPCASSLDQVGCLTRDMTDCALVMNAISGHDPQDSTSVSGATSDFTNFLTDDVKGLKIGIPQEYLQGRVVPEVMASFEQAVKKLEELGAHCAEVSLAHQEAIVATYQIIVAAEASSNLARFDGVRYGLRIEGEDVDSLFKKTRSQGLGAEAKKQIILGTYVLSSAQYEDYYLKALKVRALIKEELAKVFQEYDCLLTPTTPTVAFDLGADKEKISRGKLDSLTCLANLAGIPALSLPWGTLQGRPVGLQLLSRACGEETLFRVGYTLEQNTNQTRLKLKGKEVK
ncbi:MAG: Asp-tRNA(Asn)/Glu-tRNA(Gln) amidotransferase subunit GatA [Clostridia bacterium]|nr:Asp-tRNA(Asn)/Glu-tRNA(Gln) amidotransferase subunit GatA [Clostridia bacterium]